MIDINSILGELSAMQNGRGGMSDEELSSLMFFGQSGDDDLWVKVQINGHYQTKSIQFSQGLKDFINESPCDFWQILTDLILAACCDAAQKVKLKIVEEEASVNNGGGDILNQINEMTKGIPGFDNIMKSLGGGNPNDLMKNISNMMGGMGKPIGGGKKKK